MPLYRTLKNEQFMIDTAKRTLTIVEEECVLVVEVFIFVPDKKLARRRFSTCSLEVECPVGCICAGDQVCISTQTLEDLVCEVPSLDDGKVMKVLKQGRSMLPVLLLFSSSFHSF
mmetsp:Transcript_124196/g.356821  ORF Transcript_124196/g.356821 Transcript_124196/m.356821 type:complete len:115 (+) Transcript_124196:146-490(+)